MKTWLIIFVTLLVLVLGSSYVVWQHGPVAAAQGQQGTTVTGVCDCNGFNVTATKIPPGPTVPQGACIFNLKISQTYPSTGHIPRGIRLTTQGPVTFSSVVAGPATIGMTQTPAVVTNGATTVQWYGSTPLPNNAPPQSLATIILNPNGVSPQQVLVEWLDETGITMCRAILNLDCPCRSAIAAATATPICLGQTTTVTLNPVPPSTSLITWYSAPMVGSACPTPIPDSGTPTTGWSVAQTGGATCNTNVLPASTCYQAVITEGPNCTYASSVATVNVGQLANLNSVNATPLCKTGTETFTITDPFLIAHPWLITWKDPNGVTVASGTTSFTTPTLTATAASDCPSHSYPYSVSIADSGCGPLTKPLNVIVYHEPTATLQGPLAPLCYNQATKLHLSGQCGNVTQWWQSADNISWSPVGGSGSTPDYWTPELLTTTYYKVTVSNGTCPDFTTPSVKVEVKPQLTVSLAASSNQICNGPVTLTATPPLGYPPPLTYTWFRNGVQIAGPSTTPTLVVNQPGNYRVVISDPACGKAKSSVIRIYGRPVVTISGACGICQGGSVTLSANVKGGDPSCAYTFNWTATNGWTGTGQTVNVSPALAPGASVTYTVTTSCAGCNVSATHTITRCPP